MGHDPTKPLINPNDPFSGNIDESLIAPTIQRLQEGSRLWEEVKRIEREDKVNWVLSELDHRDLRFMLMFLLEKWHQEKGDYDSWRVEGGE